MALPDFVIIGAMKCGTSTLASQLAAQAGVFMTTPKEPNFFSDDDVYARGLPWYESLFDAAPEGALKGEASTHYTKLPTHPRAAERLHAAAPEARLIYITRDPVERLISHYLHLWSLGETDAPLEAAIERHPEMIDYGRYEMQLAPWRRLFGEARILRLTLEEMQADPQAALDRTAAFLGRPGAFVWREARARENASAERLRRLPLHGLLVQNPAAAALRRAFVPKRLREAVKDRLRASERPRLSDAARARLLDRFEDGRR
jgi:hypothetical protein